MSLYAKYAKHKTHALDLLEALDKQEEALRVGKLSVKTKLYTKMAR